MAPASLTRATVGGVAGKHPRVDEDAWLAPGVVLTGDVVVDAGANVWFGVIARGDEEPIRIGAGANVQDGTVLHTDIGYPLVLAPHSAIGHRAVVHGCTIETEALVGMGAVILNGAVIGRGALIAAGAVVKEGEEIPAGALAVGVPARVVGEAPPAPGRTTCAEYRELMLRYRAAGW